MPLSVRTGKAYYQYAVAIEKLAPPLMGRYYFAGKVARIVRFVGKAPGEDVELPPIGEAYGVTEDEAESKVDHEVRAWLLERDGPSE